MRNSFIYKLSKSRTIYIYTKFSPFSFCIWQLFAWKSPYLRSCSQYILYFIHYSGCQFYTISLCIKGSLFLQLLTTFSSLSFKLPTNSLLIVLYTLTLSLMTLMTFRFSLTVSPVPFQLLPNHSYQQHHIIFLII